MIEIGMDRDTLHLWCAYPDDLLSEEAMHVCLELLSPDERARWKAFKADRHRREYLATHALARTAISHHLGIAPEALRFQTNPFGKPSPDPECGLRFNLSNSLGLVVCLFWEGGDVGVDVEPRERGQAIREVAPRMFSPLELAQLNDLSAEAGITRCLQLWTLKEAYIKARGMGFKLPLRRFSFLYDEMDRIRLTLEPALNDDAAHWRFCLLEHAGHCIALLVDSPAMPLLRVWEARPAFAAPRRVDSVAVAWHQ
jgi:4'-phosphopantetheinyl transferase